MINMEPLKNAYNHSFFNLFLDALEEIKPGIDKNNFLTNIFIPEWELFELKERMQHITKTLHQFLDQNYIEALEEIKHLIPVLQKHNISGGYEYLFLPNYIELFGLEYMKESINSFETITPFVSCEFAIRPFIMKDSTFVIAKMFEWSFHTNFHIRRLASEGCRPRLPWGKALIEYKKNPSPILPILENLLNDSELYVRKSVANNLNDISKDHSETLISFTLEHIGKTKYTDWILKHANRNLLKQAEPKIMKAFGFGNTEHIKIQNFSLYNNKVKLGDNLLFSFELQNKSRSETLIRLEYVIYYLKQNGTLSKKNFQISEKKYTPLSKIIINKKQHFKLITTRKYHCGIHKIAVLANGKEFDVKEFDLYE